MNECLVQNEILIWIRELALLEQRNCEKKALFVLLFCCKAS